MANKKMIAILAASVLAIGLSVCGTGQANTVSDVSTKAEKTVHTESTYNAANDRRPVMTINITEEIPAADSDGEIPGADGVSDTTRETVTFGKFYQDRSGSTLLPLKWIVLDEQNGYTLLMTDQIIASKGWMDEQSDGTTWAETDLRRWLDNDFYNTAFSKEEQSHMALFDAVQPRNPRYDTPAGEASVNPVSLLSY